MLSKERNVTKREREIMKKYTRIEYDTLYLVIDHQAFTIAGTDEENIKFFQRNLAIALARVIGKETEGAIDG